MLIVRPGDVIPTSGTRRFIFTKVTETMLVLGKERQGQIPVKVTKGKTSKFTLLPIEKLNECISSPFAQKKGIRQITEITPFDQNIVGLWLHIKNLAEIPVQDPDWSWAGVKRFYVEFNKAGYICVFNKPKEPPDKEYAELVIQENGTLCLIAGKDMPLNFREQIQELNQLLISLNTADY